MLARRPIVEDDDLELLCRIYASTRAEELGVVPWTDAERDAFLRMQFAAQHRHYRQEYPQATFDVVLLDGEPIGRLYVDRRPGEIRIVDVALLPAHRGRGHGSALVREVLDEGGAAGKPVTIHVERNNPALNLYRRLGFAPIAAGDVYLLLECRPAQANTAS